MEALQCQNRGCGQIYFPADNDIGDNCRHHPGMPYFHDAYKGWSCCQNKSTDFTTFLNFPGCVTGKHSNIKPEEPVNKKSPTRDISETVEIRAPVTRSKLPRPKWEGASLMKLNLNRAKSLVQPNIAAAGSKQGTPEKELALGESCKNGGCKATYTGDSATDDASTCEYHPGVPIFHEGMKFWSCCQKRTSDFQMFLAQRGCEIGLHKWLKEKVTTASGANVIECRRDWHQTPQSVTVTIYAKKYDPEQTIVELSPVRLRVKTVFPEEDGVFSWDIELCGLISPDKSKGSMMGTKIELQLTKAEIGSWANLDIPRHVEPAESADESALESVEEAPNTQVDALDLDDLDLSGPKLVLSDAASTAKY